MLNRKSTKNGCSILSGNEIHHRSAVQIGQLASINNGIGDMIGIAIHQKLACHHQWLFAEEIDLFVIGTVSYQNGIAGVAALIPCWIVG